jgi:hypothetical protein
MDDPENEALPRDYVRGVHAELERLFRDVEKALDSLSRHRSGDPPGARHVRPAPRRPGAADRQAREGAWHGRT